MVYKLAIAPVVEFEVKLGFTDGAAQREAKFTLLGNRIDEPELRRMRSAEGLKKTTIDVLLDQLTGWREQTLVQDDAGQPAAFSADALRCLLTLPNAANVIFDAYIRAIGVEGKRGKLARLAELLALGQLKFPGDDDHDDPPQPEPAPRDARAAMAAFKRAAEAAAGPLVFHLWPEHDPVMWLWIGVQTQWREGFNGRTGLDYAAVESYMRLHGIRGAERRERHAELQVMELAALAAWSAQRQRRSG